MTFPPPCFGKEYDNEAPRCIGCAFNSHCRQEVIRMSFAQPFAPPASAVQAPVAHSFYPSPTPTFYQAAPSPPPPPPFAVPSPQFIRPQQWAPQAPPARVPVMPAPPIQQFQQPQMPQQQPWAPQPGMPSHFQIPSGLTPSGLGYFGYAPDQMWAALAAVPPMWRPQQPGETFGRRWFWNFVLNLSEVALTQGILGIRQIFMPPVARQQPQGPVVDAQR